MYCTACGEEIPDDSRFCRHCGTSLSEDIPSEPEAAESNPTENDDTTGWNVTLGKMLAYPAGILLIILGLAALAESIFAAFLFLVGGIIALPIVRRKLAESRGISISSWATIAIVIVAFLAGGIVFGANDATGPDPTVATSPDPTGAENIGDSEPQLIEEPATELVIQLEQLGVGWTEVDHSGNETHAVGEYLHSGDSAYVGTTVEKYESVEQATEAYDNRVDDIRERYGTESVRVGDEAILYAVSESAWVVFRVRNVVAEVHYQADFESSPETEAVDYAELMYENFS